MIDHLDSTKLIPFKKRGNGYHLPGLTREHEEQIIDEVDPELRPEEQGYVRHYLTYADILLKKAESEQQEAEEESTASRPGSNVTEISSARKLALYKDAA